MPELRAGLIGFGLAGSAFHAPLIQATPGLRLAAVVTSRRDLVAAAYPDAEVVGSVEELWERCDFVVVAAPNRLHVPIGREAVRRRMPVVMDKPLAVTAAEAEGLVAEAERRQVPLTVFHNRRWDGDFLTVRRLVEAGALGNVTRFESRFERFRPQVAKEVWREGADPAAGGGVLLDLGPHLVDQAVVLFGPVVAVYAEIARLRPGAAVDDDAFLALEHDGGVVSHLTMSLIRPLHGLRFAVSGLRGGLSTQGLDVQEPQLRAGVMPGDPAFGVADHEARLVDSDGQRPVTLERGDYPAFYAAVAAWLRDGGPPPVAPRDAVEGLRVLDAARQGAADRRVVSLSPTPR